MMSIMVAVLVLAVIFLDLYSRTGKIREKLRLLKQQMPDSVCAGFPANYALKGVLSGIPFTITVTHGGNRSRPKIILTCRQATPFKLVILRNESQSDFFARLAHIPILSSIVKTNDPYFDARFSVYSHNTNDVAGYFYNTGRKAAVQKIFDLGYTLLEFKGATVSAQKYEYDTEKDLQPEILKTALEKVIVLAKGFSMGTQR